MGPSKEEPLQDVTEPLLSWLRQQVTQKGLNSAALAAACKLKPSRVRKVLAGHEPMLVTELLQFCEALDLSPSDLAGVVPEVPPAKPSKPYNGPRLVPDQGSRVQVNPYGNHPEQLFQIGFGLGCDFLFLAETEQLTDSGIPDQVLANYAERKMPIKLDAAYHHYNEPQYETHAITLKLSFDAVYDCRFPWSSIRQMVFFPVVPTMEPVAKPANNGVPFLRLVK